MHNFDPDRQSMQPSSANFNQIANLNQPNLPNLEVIDIAKRFGRFVALDRVSLALAPATFHALLGENGAGKSTLVKCLIGFYQPDAGQILLDRRPIASASPRHAQRLGIGMVYQGFTSIPIMTVAENLVLARLDGSQVINWRQERQKLQAFMQQAPFPMPLDLVVGQMSAGQKQKLEILKQLYLHNRILILDEPTAVLLPHEADEVLTLLQQMVKQQRLSVLLITHKFREVLTYCDRVTVLRQGKLAGAGLVKDFSMAELAALMVGNKVSLQRAVIAEQEHLKPVVKSVNKPISNSNQIGHGGDNTNGHAPNQRHGSQRNSSLPSPHRLAKLTPPHNEQSPKAQFLNRDRFPSPDPAIPLRSTTPVLQLNQITAKSDQGLIAVDQVSFSVDRGEIVGIAGVAGNGQKELMEVLFGQRIAVSGEILVNGEVYGAQRSQMQKHRIFALPEEPLHNACIGTMSVAENLALRNFDRPPLARGWLLLEQAIRQFAQRLVKTFAIKAASIDLAIANLSGGNIQRTVLARELSAAKIQLLMAVNPCAGLDFTAVADICQKLRAARDRGVAILLVSDDLDELLMLSDRLLVISDGALVYECVAQDAELSEIAHHMAGGTNL
jgi:ABC-type uncharacterized transport system ATPase subunit